MDVKLCITIPVLQHHFECFLEVVMISIVGPNIFDENFYTLQALVQYRKRWEAFQAYKTMNIRYFFLQNGGQIIIELTNMNDIYVRERLSQKNTARHRGQYRNKHRIIFWRSKKMMSAKHPRHFRHWWRQNSLLALISLSFLISWSSCTW